MPELSAIINDVPVEVVVELEHDTFTLAYHPARITGLVYEEAREAERAQDIPSLAKFLAAVVSDWSLTENGKPFPVTYESLMSLPLNVLGAMLNGISDAASGSEEGNASSSSPRNGAQASTTPSSTEQNHSSLDTSRPPVTAT